MNNYVWYQQFILMYRKKDFFKSIINQMAHCNLCRHANGFKFNELLFSYQVRQDFWWLLLIWVDTISYCTCHSCCMFSVRARVKSLQMVNDRVRLLKQYIIFLFVWKYAKKYLLTWMKNDQHISAKLFLNDF